MRIKAQLFTGWHEQLLRLVAVQEKRLDWFHLQEGQYASLKPDSTGVIRSQIFPGLWLLVTALQAGDLVQVLAVLQDGLQNSRAPGFCKVSEPLSMASA